MTRFRQVLKTKNLNEKEPVSYLKVTVREFNFVGLDTRDL